MTMTRHLSDRNGKRKSDGRKDSSKSDRRNKRGGDSKKSGNARVDNKDTCPVHHSHKWGDCYLNPRCNDYRPVIADNKSNSSNKDKGSKSKKDSHHTAKKGGSKKTVSFNDDDSYSSGDEQDCYERADLFDSQDQDSFFFHADVELESVEYDDHFAVEPKKIVFDDAHQDLIPTTVVTVMSVGTSVCNLHLVALLDSGGSHVVIAEESIPSAAISLTQDKVIFSTTAGKLESSAHVLLESIHLPEFSRTRSLGTIKAYTFSKAKGKVVYDIILGRDFLVNAGIEMNFASKTVKWSGVEISMKPRNYWKDQERLRDLLQVEPTAIARGWKHLESYTSAILDAQYGKVDLDDIVSEQTHLSQEQRNDLAQLLHKHHRLFNAELKPYPGQNFHIDLEPDSKPFHAKPYKIPYVHQATSKKELDRLVKIGVLRHQGPTEWAAGTFIIPKKANAAV
jgi:hypothetical protein